MSLLHQDTPEEIDDAALGEEFTKGSGHLLWTTLAAAVVVSITIAIYFIAGQKPPAVTGDIVAVWAHPQHTETSGFDANGAPMPKESFDQVLVFAEVRLHNQSKAASLPAHSPDQCHARTTASIPAMRPPSPTTTGSSSPIRTCRFLTARRFRSV